MSSFVCECGWVNCSFPDWPCRKDKPLDQIEPSELPDTEYAELTENYCGD